MKAQFRPLPPHADPRKIVSSALLALRPPTRILPTESARRLNVYSGGEWRALDPSSVPYLIEPTNMAARRRYRAIVVCAPSQSGKTQMLQNLLCHTILADPGRVALFQMTRDAAKTYEQDKIAPMILNSPALAERVPPGRRQNIFEKTFIGGTRLTLNWPTPEQMSSATIRITMATDFDHFGPSIGGEGDPLTLLRARTRSLGSRGKTIIESSPVPDVQDGDWAATSPHEAPPVPYGVLAAYNDGTRARWYWSCPDCEERFEPRFDRLIYDQTLSPAEAGLSARMACPHCGSVISPDRKHDLNATGIWLHEAGDGQLVTIDDPAIRATDMASYWLHGPAAVFSTWSELVQQYETALRHFERTGDESKLRAAYNTGLGQPYLPRGSLRDGEVTEDQLKMRADQMLAEGVAPDWVRYLTVTVDMQISRFPYLIMGWGLDGRHVPIKRGDLEVMPGTERSVRPFDHPEDWSILTQLEDVQIPVAGTDYSLRPVLLLVDRQGSGSATVNAYEFWRGRRSAGRGHLWRLSRGEGREPQDLIWERAPQTARGDRRAATDVPTLHMAANRLKDMVMASARRADKGPMQMVIPQWFCVWIPELLAEMRGPKGWDKRPGAPRNETLDLVYAAHAARLRLGGDRIDPLAPPAWAREMASNSMATMVSQDSDAPAAAPARPPKERRRVLTMPEDF